MLISAGIRLTLGIYPGIYPRTMQSQSIAVWLSLFSNSIFIE